MKLTPAQAVGLIGDMKDDLDRLRDVIQRQRNAGPEQLPAFDPDPMDPRNKRPSGQFTERGVEVLYRLFDRGATPETAALLMGVTLHTAQYRKQWWEKVGGLNRERIDLEP